MANASVERFRKLTEQLQVEVVEAAIDELNKQAERLAGAIRDVAPRGKTGVLEHTIRTVPGNKPTIVRVVEGSPQTIHAGYQYPRAAEFGTINMPPKPHFFPTYRLLKKSIIAAMKRKIAANIKKRSAE